MPEKRPAKIWNIATPKQSWKEAAIIYLRNPQNFSVLGYAVVFFQETIKDIVEPAFMEQFPTSALFGNYIVSVLVPPSMDQIIDSPDYTILDHCAFCGGPIDSAAGRLNCEYCGMSPQFFEADHHRVDIDSLPTPLPRQVVQQLRSSGFHFLGSPESTWQMERLMAEHYNRQLVRAPMAVIRRFKMAALP